MPTIPEIRAQFPQYDDMSDSDLAESLYQTYYSDMPFGEFAGKIGFKRDWAGMPGEMKQSAGGNASEMLSGFSNFIQSPVESLGKVGELAAGGIDNLVGMGLDAFGVDRGTPSPEQANRRGGASQAGRAIADTLGTAEGFKHYVARKPVSALTDVAGLLAGGAGLLPKLSKTAKATELPMKRALLNSPPHKTVAGQTKQMFDNIKAKDVQLSPDEFIPARDSLGRFIEDEGITGSDAPRGLAQFDRLNDILPPHKQPAPKPNIYGHMEYPVPQPDVRTVPLNEVESVRRAAGRIDRAPFGSATDTDKMIAGKLKKTIDGYYNNSVDPGIAKEMEAAREMGRRNILAKQIKEMSRKAEDGYVSGTESGYRNQFAAYLKKNSASLSPAEKKAFKKVSRREGFLGAANILGSKLGLLTTGVVGGPGLMAGSYGARKLMEFITKGAVDKAEKTVLMGIEAQNKGLLGNKQLRNKRIINGLLAAEAIDKLGPR